MFYRCRDGPVLTVPTEILWFNSPTTSSFPTHTVVPTRGDKRTGGGLSSNPVCVCVCVLWFVVSVRWTSVGKCLSSVCSSHSLRIVPLGLLSLSTP